MDDDDFDPARLAFVLDRMFAPTGNRVKNAPVGLFTPGEHNDTDPAFLHATVTGAQILEWLQLATPAADDTAAPLNAWERKFVHDLYARVEDLIEAEIPSSAWASGKQLVLLKRMVSRLARAAQHALNGDAPKRR